MKLETIRDTQEDYIITMFSIIKSNEEAKRIMSQYFRSNKFESANIKFITSNENKSVITDLIFENSGLTFIVRAFTTYPGFITSLVMIENGEGLLHLEGLQEAINYPLEGYLEVSKSSLIFKESLGASTLKEVYGDFSYIKNFVRSYIGEF